jgi:hypothetical protein
VAEVAELREKVTRAHATAVMAGARAIREEKIAQERVVLLASTRGEANEVAKKPSLLEGELVVAHWAQEEVEERYEHLVNELTLLRLRGPKLWLAIVGTPPQGLLHEGMRFTVTHYSMVATRLSAL